MLRNYWRVACRTPKLKEKQPLAARVFDTNLVLFRDRLGNAAALRDKCCHRGAPLSIGSVIKRHSRIKCAVHGWEFNTDGKCAHIPLEPSVPTDNFKIDSYKTLEQDGYVWVWMGDGEPGPEPPSIPEIGRYFWKQHTRVINVDPLRAIETMADWTMMHFYYKHNPLRKTLMPVKPGAERAFEIKVHDLGFDMFESLPPKKRSAEPRRAIQFILPDRIVIKKQAGWDGWGSLTDFIMVIHFVPYVLDGRLQTRAEFMYTVPMPGLKLGRDKVAEPWFIHNMVTSTVKLLDAFGKTSGDEQLIKDVDEYLNNDALATDYPRYLTRKILQLAADGKWTEESRATLPLQKVVKYREPFY